MSPSRVVDPIQALRWCTEKLNPRSPETISLGEAPRGFLAAAVDLSAGAVPQKGSATTPTVAARNGYAVSEEAQKDSVYTLLGTITADGTSHGPDGSPLSPADEFSRPHAGIWRVDTGAPMPAGTDRVVPVSEGTLLGRDRVRLHGAVSPGTGVDRGVRFWTVSPESSVIPAGSRLDDRLRSLLLARQVERVRVRSPFAVGYGSIGEELIDLSVSGPIQAGQTRDLSGYWLGDAIATCGQRAVPLGILPDEPRRLGEVIGRCRSRHVEVAVLSGGVGHGFADRVVESLRRIDARILFTEVALNNGLGFVLAKTQGVDVLVLCGRPLWCAAMFDLFVGPAILARAGAGRFYWDWTRGKDQLLRPEGLEKSKPHPEGAWRVFPALSGVEDRDPRVPLPAATPSWLPVLPGQRGWVVARAHGDAWQPVFFASAAR